MQKQQESLESKLYRKMVEKMNAKMCRFETDQDMKAKDRRKTC